MSAGATMTTSGGSPGGGTALRLGPRPPAVRRGLVVGAVIGVLVLGFVIVSALVTRTSDQDALDIRSARPAGARALAQILRDRGVTVSARDAVPPSAQRARTPDTLVVLAPGRLDRGTLTALLGRVWQGSDVVLVGAGDAVLDALGVNVQAANHDPGSDATPRCALPEAVAAGTTSLTGSTAYTSAVNGPRADMRVSLCFGDPPRAARLAVLTPGLGEVPAGAIGGGRLVLLGSADFITNHALDRDGNAALALGLLGRHPDLSWITPVAGTPGGVGQRGVLQLLPTGVRWALLQIVIVIVLLALWRGRRLGPPVQEPLPVVVRAAEAVEGRGRLYAAARARDHAADALRAGARIRLAERAGLPLRTSPTGTPEPNPVALTASVAEQTGRSPSEIGSLLYGSGMPPPTAARPGPARRALDRSRSRDLPPDRARPPVAGAPAAGAASRARGARGEPGGQDAALLRLAQNLDDLDRQAGGR